MIEPKWILDEMVIAVHQRQIAKHGGIDGIRDEGLLSSALARPKNLYHFSDPKPSLDKVAAAYAYGIARNHAFFDGNKRSAYVVCRLFLVSNGADFKAEISDKYQAFIKLAAGEMTEEELAHWITSHCDRSKRQEADIDLSL